MAFTQSDLAAIRAAMAKGERSVQFADRSVTYRSMAELREVEQIIVRSLAGRPKQTLIVGSKGF